MRIKPIIMVIIVLSVLSFIFLFQTNDNYVYAFKPKNAPVVDKTINETTNDIRQENKPQNTIKTNDISNTNIKFLTYINDRDGYKISYPAGVEIVLDGVGLNIADKNKGWKFIVESWNCCNYKNLEQHVNEIIQEGKDNGYAFLEKKPLNVAGQRTIMINSLSDDIDRGKLNYTKIVMHANNMEYIFKISAPVDKFNQYADLLFKILKSFEFIVQSKK